MKKITLIAFVAIAMLCSRQNVNAQISVDHVYTTDPPRQAFKLSSGLKYFAEHYSTNNSVTYFVLYNPDHSIFRTINVPQIPGKYDLNISFVSDALFDTDTLIEYMLYYSDTVNPPVYDVAILNENGNTLLYEDSAQFDVTSDGGDLYRGFVLRPIFPDGNQIKLYLYKGLPSTTVAKTIVYNLPGQFTCIECVGGFVNGIVQPPHLISEENKSLAYPNPSTDYIKIKYSLPPNFNRAFVNLYDLSGKLIKQKEIDGQYEDIYLSTEEIRQGAYSYTIIVDGKKMSSGKIIKL